MLDFLFYLCIDYSFILLPIFLIYLRIDYNENAFSRENIVVFVFSIIYSDNIEHHEWTRKVGFSIYSCIPCAL
jgi:hypothetical protein